MHKCVNDARKNVIIDTRKTLDKDKEGKNRDYDYDWNEKWRWYHVNVVQGAPDCRQIDSWSFLRLLFHSFSNRLNKESSWILAVSTTAGDRAPLLPPWLSHIYSLLHLLRTICDQGRTCPHFKTLLLKAEGILAIDIRIEWWVHGVHLHYYKL